MITKKIKSALAFCFLIVVVVLFLSRCAATCVTCNTCPNTVGMSGYN